MSRTSARRRPDRWPPRRAARARRARVAARVRAVLVESGCAPDADAAGTEPVRAQRWVPGAVLERPPETPAGPGVAAAGGPVTRGAGAVRLRWDMGTHAARALVVAVLVVVAAGAWWLTASHPRAVSIADQDPVPTAAAPTGFPRGSPVPAAPPSTGQPAATSTAPARLVVDVAGRVRRPGVYSLPSGSRVQDALRAAGGARPGVDTDSLNLAQPLMDGEQVIVGRASAQFRGAALPAAGASVDGAAAPPSAPVDLNTATLEQLETLPGVGPATAQKILDWRTAHGSFATVDQLDDVSGIGPVTLERLRPLVTV